MGKLKEIHLPNSIMWNERYEKSFELIETLSRLRPPIEIRFKPVRDAQSGKRPNKCILFPNSKEQEYTESGEKVESSNGEESDQHDEMESNDDEVSDQNDYDGSREAEHSSRSDESEDARMDFYGDNDWTCVK